MTYQELKRLHESAKCPIKGKPFGSNTRIVKVGDNYGVQYHRTVIYEVNKWNIATIDTDGWHTVMTKARLNQLIRPLYIYQQNFQWYLRHPNGTTSLFEDGYQFSVDNHDDIEQSLDMGGQ